MAEAAKKSLSGEFNFHSALMWAMNISMIGMVAAMVGNIAGGQATIGDALVQGFIMIGFYAVTAFTTGIPVGMDMIGNLFDGEILPTTYDMGSMHDVSSAASDTGGHTAHGGEVPSQGTQTPVAGGGLTDIFANAADFASGQEWFESLPADKQKWFSDSAAAFKMPLEDYVSAWCSENGVTLPENWAPAAP